MQIFSFGLGEPATEFSPEVLGGKGAGLVWMDSKTIPVPPGFILPCSLMSEYQAKPKTFMKQVAKEIEPWLQRLKAKFGYMPLVSVRSGARQSMPGMLDTILNVGLDSSTFDFWSQKLGSECAEDSYKRLIEMYTGVVKGIDRKEFARCKTVEEMQEKYRGLHDDQPFPMAKQQVVDCIEAVFKSWFNERAKIYRQQNQIPEEWGTAVVVQAMVFGNFNENSGTGVLFTRDANTGENVVCGEFLVNAQGEDVVAGIRTPMPLKDMHVWNKGVATQLLELVEHMEILKRDVQDVEFTIQDGKLFILQTRNAKRTPAAALQIALDMYAENLIDAKTALARVTPRQFDLAQQPVLDPKFKEAPFATGLSACSGVVTGKVVKSSAAAINCTEPCILVTKETCPDDIGGMYASLGVVTMEGGMTSHAAVVARGMNKPCITGVGLSIEQFEEGSILSMDGATGRLWHGVVPVIDGGKSANATAYLALQRKTVPYCPVVHRYTEGLEGLEVLYVPGTPLTWAQDIGSIHLLAEQCPRVYIDLRPQKVRLDAVEQEFAALFTPSADQTVMLCETLRDLPSSVREKLVTVGQKISGIKYVASLDNLHALIMAEPGSEVLMELASDPAVAKVLKWKEQDGPLTALSYGALQPGVKSFVSDSFGLLLDKN